jgi:hypothetical protein
MMRKKDRPFFHILAALISQKFSLGTHLTSLKVMYGPWVNLIKPFYNLTLKVSKSIILAYIPKLRPSL